MRFFFADDSKQQNPTRDGMGSLVAIGGVAANGDSVRALEQEIGEICAEFGFPAGQEFKWSPGAGLWMRTNLIEDCRQEFFLRVLRLAAAHEVGAVFVAEDIRYARATPNAPTPEIDVTRMFLERADTCLRKQDVNDYGVVITDRPGGGRGEEDAFLFQCLETLQKGTRYVMPARIALPVLSAPSDLVRLSQLADVVTGCTLAYVGGENRFAPPVFEAIKPLLLRDGQRIGGIGLKIHPDYIYVNLHHWLVGDSHHVKWGAGIPLPLLSRPYAGDPDHW